VRRSVPEHHKLRLQSHFGFSRLPFNKNVVASEMFDSRSQREVLLGLRLWTDVKGIASVTGRAGPLMGAWLLGMWGCEGERGPHGRPGPDEPEDSAVLSTGVTGSTGSTGDTGAPEEEGWPQWPVCSHQPQTQVITLLADQADDQAGRYLDAADVDGDGCAEVLVSAHRPYGLWDLDIDTASYLLREPWSAGGLEEHAFAIFEGPPTGYDGWATNNVLLPAVGQTAIGGAVYDGDLYAVHLHDLRGALQGSRRAIELAVARIHVPSPYPGFGVSGDLSDCVGSDGLPSLCLGTISSDTESPQNASGQVLVYEAPLSGDVHIVDDARSRIVGDAGERAQMVQSRADFDGDGRADLLVGAYEALAGAGRVGLVTSLPEGSHRLWDITQAHVQGSVQGGELGLSMASGDLDGDGHVDLLAGAPIANEAYVLRGPLSGDRSVSEAEWTVSGTEDAQWTGYGAAISDLDGDGQAELAIGVPYSIYLGSAPPGAVALWFSPAPGRYSLAQAQRTLTLGRVQPDAFGLTLASGDIDGDGLGDLAIGAPRDPAPGPDGGSVTLVFGASL
jgi:hypothetical protein